MTLEEAADHIGSTVTYAPPGGARLGEATLPGDTGTITFVTSRYIFVRYHGDTHSKATAPANLHLTPAGGP